MTERLQHTLEGYRYEQQETNPTDHSKGKETTAQKTPNALARFSLDSPDRIQRVLELAEDPGGAEQRKCDTDDRRHSTFARLRRLLRDILHDLHRALVKEIAHLLCDFVPGACWVLSKEHTNNRQQHENQRCEGKDGVVGKSRA